MVLYYYKSGTMEIRYFKFDNGDSTMIFKCKSKKVWHEYRENGWKWMPGYFILPEDNKGTSHLVELSEKEAKNLIFIKSL